MAKRSLTSRAPSATAAQADPAKVIPAAPVEAAEQPAPTKIEAPALTPVVEQERAIASKPSTPKAAGVTQADFDDLKKRVAALERKAQASRMIRAEPEPAPQPEAPVEPEVQPEAE